MKRKLRVYGWRGFNKNAGGTHHQTREICAATSKNEVARAAGVNSPRRLDCLTETGNAREIAIAIAAPGVVFWSEINPRPDSEWRRMESATSPAQR